jgi:hypothetical protein
VSLLCPIPGHKGKTFLNFSIGFTSVADPGCFIPDPTIAPSRIPDPQGKKAPDPTSFFTQAINKFC